jgi:hypothetical protein
MSDCLIGAGPKFAIRSFAAVLMLCVTHAEVDLTPIESSYELDGVKMSNVLFRDGRQEITYCPPQGWRLSGEGSRLTLVPVSLPNTDARVEVKSLATALPFDDAGIKKYVESTRLSIPRDARGIEVLGTQLNPLRICGYDTLAVEIKFDAFGASFRTQSLYLNRDRQQWVFRFTAPVNSFERAFEPFRSSLYSISGL